MSSPPSRPDLTAQGDRCYIVLRTAGTDQVFQFDDVRLFEMGPDTGWTYAGSMDTRDAAIPHTDGGMVCYGVWTNSGSSEHHQHPARVSVLVGSLLGIFALIIVDVVTKVAVSIARGVFEVGGRCSTSCGPTWCPTCSRGGD